IYATQLLTRCCDDREVTDVPIGVSGHNEYFPDNDTILVRRIRSSGIAAVLSGTLLLAAMLGVTVLRSDRASQATPARFLRHSTARLAVFPSHNSGREPFFHCPSRM